MDKLEQIYQDGLKRLESMPDYHFSDSKPKKSHSIKGTPVRGIPKASFASRKVAYAASIYS